MEKVITFSAMGFPVTVTASKFDSLIKLKLDAGIIKQEQTFNKEQAIQELENALAWLKE